MAKRMMINKWDPSGALTFKGTHHSAVFFCQKIYNFNLIMRKHQTQNENIFKENMASQEYRGLER